MIELFISIWGGGYDLSTMLYCQILTNSFLQTWQSNFFLEPCVIRGEALFRQEQSNTLQVFLPILITAAAAQQQAFHIFLLVRWLIDPLQQQRSGVLLCKAVRLDANCFIDAHSRDIMMYVLPLTVSQLSIRGYTQQPAPYTLPHITQQYYITNS